MDFPPKNYMQQGIKVKGKLTSKEAKYGAKFRKGRSVSLGCLRLDPYLCHFCITTTPFLAHS
jgi:hypothetical protein